MFDRFASELLGLSQTLQSVSRRPDPQVRPIWDAPDTKPPL